MANSIPLTAAVAQAKADRLRAVARGYKKEERGARKKVRRTMREFDEWVAECRANGINVIVEDQPAEPRRQSGDGRAASVG